MRPIVLYLATTAVFLVLDAIMLTSYMTPLFRSHVGDLMAVPIRGLPAILFYLGYVAAVLYLAGWPALRDGAPGLALRRGAVLGAAAYGTFEFTNYAILQAWHIQMVISDTIWGAVLTGISAWSGVVITQRLRGQSG